MKYLRLLAFAVFGVLCCNYSYAYDFEVDGMYYNILSSNSVEITYREIGKTYSGELVIPTSVGYNGKNYDVISIGYMAFASCGLTGSLTIPSSITSIGRSAFNGCYGLTGSLTIPNSVTSIGAYAFHGCSGFTGSLMIPNSVTSIGEFAFCKCSGFTGSLIISSSITSIEESVFSQCYRLTGSLTIPSSVTIIKYSAFWGCRELRGTLTIPSSVISIEGMAFYECWGLTGSLTIPNSVTSIGESAFQGCSGFTGSLIIPNSVESIGASAFSGCGRLTGSLIIPNSVTFIGNSAFSGCSGLTGSLTIPSSVTSIEEGTFYNCRGLADSLIIPNSIKSIGGAAFNGCKQIKLVISKILSPFSISDNVFFNLNAVLQVPKGTKNSYQALSGWNNSFKEIREEVGGTHVLSITASGNGSASFSGTAVRGNTSTFNVVEGSSATVSFTPDEGCHIASVKVNNTDVTSSVVNNQYTINNITSDLSVDVVFGKESFVVNGIRYNILDYIHKEVEVTYNFRNEYNEWVGYDGDIVVPGTVAYNGITYKVIKIGKYAFKEEEQDWNFAPWSTLTSVTISEGIESIGDWAFSDCVVLKKVVMPSSITSIGRSAFNECRSLQSIEIPNGVTTIEDHTFYFCKSLTSIKLPSNLSTIKASSFGICSSLEEIKLPETLKSIEKRSFHDCGLLSKVVSYIKSPFAIDKESFQKICSSPVLYVPKGTKADYSSASGWKDIFNEIVEIEITNSCQLNIIASGNGSVSFNGTSVRDETRTLTVSEGTSATVSFTPDSGYRIASVIVNGVDVTSSVVNNQYTISNITAHTTLSVTFEAIPPTIYTLFVTSSGNGFASYAGTTVRDRTSTFDVVEGSSVTVSLTPDSGHRIASVIVNGVDVTSGVSDSQYTIGSITANTTLSVTFEAIPPTVYTLFVTSSGNGFASYAGTTVRDKMSTFSVVEGSSVTVSFTPDSGHRIASVIVNGVDVTSGVSGSQYTIGNITANTTLSVTFEKIPPTVYNLSVVTSGNGSVLYDGRNIRNGSQTFSVEEGLSVVVSLIPDTGCRIAGVEVNNIDATSQVAGNSYIVNDITEDVTIKVMFEEIITALDAEGVNYMVVSQKDRTIQVAGGDYGQVLTVPATVVAQGYTWQVTGIEKDALKDNANLAAVIWEPKAAFTATVSNPNLLLYVKDEQYAQSDVKNVVVNGVANSIVLVEAATGNSFYCPQAFTAHHISYTHNYQMQTGIGESKGWETLALPFDVQSITHKEKGNVVPFASRNGSDERPFWLYELTGSGFVESSSIKAYTPYIISMPNHPQYYDQWLLRGNVTFAASNVTVGVTSDVLTATYGDRTFAPCFTEKGSNEGLYALNVNNDYVANNSGMTEGSKFVLNMRRIHPFEAYMTTISASPQYSFGIFDGMATKVGALEVRDLMKDETYYDLQGRKTMAPTRKGVYITNGRKKMIR